MTAAPMIPLRMRPASERVPGMISVPVPSRHRTSMLAASVASLRGTAARPELTEILVAHDPDDPATAEAARSLGADLVQRAPERHGYARSSLYYARLLEEAHGEWALVTWSDDAVMETPGWDERLRTAPAGTVAYLDGNFAACTCFPAVHADVLAAVGRLSPLPSLDTWFEDAARDAGILATPGIYVRQDRPDLNARNDDQTHREGGAAWRAANYGYGQDYYQEPYTAWRAEDAARMRALHARQPPCEPPAG